MTDPDKNITVYLVEDDAAVLDSLSALLTSHGYEPVACQSAEVFLRHFDPNRKACLVLDLRLPGMSGIQLQRHLSDMGHSVPIIIITAHGDVPIAVEAMRAGAFDFIEKPAKSEHLLDALRSAALIAHDIVPPKVPKAVVADRLAKLTDREREVLGYLVTGKLNKEIADDLGLSRRTVEVHRSRIREKMQARGIADLIRMLR